MSTRRASGIDNPAPDLPFNTMRLPAGSELHRVHNHRWGSTAFNPDAPVNPALGNPGSRFAPFRSGSRFVPTLYAGNSLDVAAFETIFHDVDPAEPFKTVSMSQLSALSYSIVRLTHDVVITRLFQPDLKKLALARRDLIDCPASEYHRISPWSQAIYEAPAATAGMVWTSRQFDEGRAYMLFGPRLDDPSLELVFSLPIIGDATTLEKIRELGELAGITIVHS